MNSNSYKKNILIGYVQNKNFGPYYLPVAQQNQILKLYCDQKKKKYSLPQAEPIFSIKYPRLKSLLNELKKNEGLVMSSFYMLPKKKLLRYQIYNLVIKKNAELHFVFEKMVLANKKDIQNLENNIKLTKFTSQSNFIFENLS